MKNTGNERGVAMLLEIVLLAVVLSVVGFAVYRFIQVTHTEPAKQTADTGPNATPIVTKSKTEGWTEYRSAKEGLKFKYPKDWTLVHFSQGGEGNYDLFTISSPNRFAVIVKIKQDAIDGGCDECKIDDTAKIEQLDIGYGEPLYLIEQRNGMFISSSRTDWHGVYKSKIPAVNDDYGSQNYVEIHAGMLQPDGTLPIPSLSGKAATVTAEYDTARTILNNIHY